MVAILFVSNWKSSTAELGEEQASSELAEPKQEKPALSEEEFLKSVFTSFKSPQFVVDAVNNPDSLALQTRAITWSKEAQVAPLYFYLKERSLNDKSTLDEMALFSKLLMSNAASVKDGGQSSFMINMSRKWIDLGLKRDPNYVPLLNALIVYQSEYVDQPMKFLATLRKTLALDSMNNETNFIHLNLLKTSGQLPKAIEKCKKLVSLQPQNSFWLDQMSEIYGMMGDSVNARIFLDLAIKQRRTKNLKK